MTEKNKWFQFLASPNQSSGCEKSSSIGYDLGVKMWGVYVEKEQKFAKI